jgi:carotenoid cleavage dioxygenase-like enzyme
VDSSILEKRDKLLKELLPGLLFLFGDAYEENDDVTLEDILAMDKATWEEEEDRPIWTAHQRNEVQLELPFEPPLDRVMARAKVLRTAEKYVCKDRAAQHGDMEDNFQTIASYWGVHLGTEVTATDVAVMMTLLKVARIKGNAAHTDNWVDGCGYLACGGELAGGDVE